MVLPALKQRRQRPCAVPYRPPHLAAQIACAILFCGCQADSVAPAVPAPRYAAKAPRGEIRMYPKGHFEV